MVKPALFHLKLFQSSLARFFERTRKREIAVELRNKPACRFRQIKPACNVRKLPPFFSAYVEVKFVAQLYKPFEHKSHAVIRVGVVINIRVVFVGARNLKYLVSAVRFGYAAKPKQRAFFQHFHAVFEHERGVARTFVIIYYPHRNIRIYVRLHKRMSNVIPHFFFARNRRTESVFRAFIAQLLGVFFRLRKHTVAI